VDRTVYIFVDSLGLETHFSVKHTILKPILTVEHTGVPIAIVEKLRNLTCEQNAMLVF
jgi:hypothetical protein